MPRWLDVAHFEVDHIQPEVHAGASVAANFAWACFRCNNRKAVNLAGIDPDTGQLHPLFHPRRDIWNDHFEWDGPQLAGKTPVGRATIAVLTIDAPGRVAFRQELISEGTFPPEET